MLRSIQLASAMILLKDEGTSPFIVSKSAVLEVWVFKWRLLIKLNPESALNAWMMLQYFSRTDDDLIYSLRVKLHSMRMFLSCQKRLQLRSWKLLRGCLWMIKHSSSNYWYIYAPLVDRFTIIFWWTGSLAAPVNFLGKWRGNPGTKDQGFSNSPPILSPL